MSENDHKGYGAARRLDKFETLKSMGVVPMYLDITNKDSSVELVEQIIKIEGRIDVLINNAGYGSYGAIADMSLEETQRQLNVNLFGVTRLTKLVLPYMREQAYGKLLILSLWVEK